MTIFLASKKSSRIETIGNIIFTFSIRSELRIEIICSLKRSFSSKEYLIPLTPRNGFSSLGKFKYGTCLSPPMSKVLKTIVLENFVFNSLLISICSFNVGFEDLSI